MKFISSDLEKYSLEQSSAFDAATAKVLAELERLTHLRTLMPQMLSSGLQGQWLAFVSRMLRPRRVLEIGTFTGYSSICLCQGLAPGGELHTIDINDELLPIIREYQAKAGIADRVRVHIGDALEVIDRIEGDFDLVFIDADKVNYIRYYHKIIDRVRSGGYIMADNVLWSGKVLEPERDKTAQAIHEFNQTVSQDPRLRCLLLPLRDGILLMERL